MNIYFNIISCHLSIYYIWTNIYFNLSLINKLSGKQNTSDVENPKDNNLPNPVHNKKYLVTKGPICYPKHILF